MVPSQKDFTKDISYRERTTSMHVETKHFLMLWHPLIKPVEASNTLSIIRCSLVVQRRSKMGEKWSLPTSLQSMPVVHPQGEEDVEDFHVVFLILIPCSHRQKSWWNDWSPTLWQSLAKKCESIFGASRKDWEWSFLPCNLPGGTIPPT